MKHRMAFTITEIIVVLLIIAMVVAISTPIIVKSRKRAIEAASVSNMRQLHLAVEMYRADYDSNAFGSMEEMGLPDFLDWSVLGRSVKGLHPPTMPSRWHYLYYPIPSSIDHRVPTWAEYTRTKGGDTVLLADLCLEDTTPIHKRDPFRPQYGVGIRLNGGIAKQLASGDLDVKWWDR